METLTPERCPHDASYGEDPRICIHCGAPIDDDNVIRLRVPDPDGER